MKRPGYDPFAASTDAQAFVIGAFLIITIAVTASILYFAINAPMETKKCEFIHSGEVTDDFVMLNSAINSLLRAESSVASTSVPIKMTPTKASRISLPLASGSLSFSPNEETITVSVNESGTGDAGAPDTWFISNFSNNFSTVSGDVKVEDGNLTLAGPPYSSACIVSNMSNVSSSGSIGYDTGSNSTRYENISWNATTSFNTEIVMEVRTSINSDMSNSTDWVEVENGENLSSNLPTLNGHRYVQFRATLITYDPSKRPTLIDICINYSPFNGILANSSGVITFASNYHYLPNFMLSYENGAVIKNQTQPEGGFVVHANDKPVSFNMSFNASGSGVPVINISLINLTGTNVPTYSGVPSASVRLFRCEHELISDFFYYPNITINITSKNANIIKKWFDKRLNDSPLTASDEYNYTKVSGKNFEIVFYGHGGGVQLYLEKTSVEVEI